MKSSFLVFRFLSWSQTADVLPVGHTKSTYYLLKLDGFFFCTSEIFKSQTINGRGTGKIKHRQNHLPAHLEVFDEFSLLFPS